MNNRDAQKFRKACASLDLNKVLKIANKNGISVNMDNLPNKTDLDKKTLESGLKSLETKKKDWIFNQSLYSGDIPINFSVEKWDIAKQENQEQAKKLGNQAYKLAKMMEQEPMNVVMLGKRGVGKTALALMMLDELKKSGKSVMFVSTAELADLFSYQYEYEDIKKRINYIAKAMTTADVLLLDDFGTEGGMKGDLKPVRSDMQKKLYQIFNARVDFENNSVRKSTIITTNNHQDELNRMYNPKLISRLIPKDKNKRLAFNEMEEVRNV